MEATNVPRRDETMRSVEQFLHTRDRTVRSGQITSAYVVGLVFLSIGAVSSILFWFDLVGQPLAAQMGALLIGLGLAFIVLGRVGSAKYRVTNFSRYPQQTGEITDMYFQLLGEKFLWFCIAVTIIAAVSLALILSLA